MIEGLESRSPFILGGNFWLKGLYYEGLLSRPIGISITKRFEVLSRLASGGLRATNSESPLGLLGFYLTVP